MNINGYMITSFPVNCTLNCMFSKVNIKFFGLISVYYPNIFIVY
ncbi:hypothetical protein CU005_2716 [Enterococcus faecium]|nr:hypothetical protein [Enterococcus faecium]MBK4789050.1 hypothetical protein [Enterococcus faecium]MBK4791766.1 hypothetical protein [Enterococcus faecium]MBK4833612.1 hypothetical protein [Enterococcus faecium]MBK4849440.1 hypothetical protein [Enterococcus faecium]